LAAAARLTRHPVSIPETCSPPAPPIQASILIPTRARPGYLAVALASVAPQAQACGAEVIVVDDAGPSPAVAALAERHGARYEPHPAPLGLNVARNTGVRCSSGELVVFLDDDIEVGAGWLGALLQAATEYPDADVFAGPIRARLEGPAPRSCGREQPPITTLDLGPHITRDIRFAWGANMAIRRSALERVGPFDTSLEHGGDEQEWQERLLAQARSGARPIVYVAAAAVDHRRAGDDARLRSLARTAFARGRAGRRLDALRGQAPSLPRETLTLLGCLGHVVRYRCPAGLTMAAHSLGRLQEGLRQRRRGSIAQPDRAQAAAASAPADAKPAPADDFLSGSSGTVGGLDALRRELTDRALDARELATGRSLRLALAARREPPARRVLVLGVERPEHRAAAAAAHRELLRSRHEVELYTCPPGDRGRFENLNGLLAAHPPAQHNVDWLLTIDDDVTLPRGFLDRLLFLAERLALDLAQPAHRLRSHAAWQVTRRQPGVVARETRFVEIGPITLFAPSTFATLLPFPPLRMGWGLDLHWAALARSRGWRLGVLDAVAIGHATAPAASAYSRAEAQAEARAFLAHRPHLGAEEAQVTLATHRRW
jgi:GT2 family glycosyltransferase